MATINEIKQQAAAVKNATQVGENTAERVGGVLAGIAELAEQQDSKLSDLSITTSINNAPIQATLNRYINSDGIISQGSASNKNYCTDYIPVNKGEKYIYHGEYAKGTFKAVWGYSDNQGSNPIALVDFTGEEQTTEFTIDNEQVKYIIAWGNTNTEVWVGKEGVWSKTETQGRKIEELSKKVESIPTNQITQNKEAIENLDSKLNGRKIQATLKGYIDTNGVYQSQANNLCTDYISVSQDEKFIYHGKYAKGTFKAVWGYSDNQGSNPVALVDFTGEEQTIEFSINNEQVKYIRAWGSTDTEVWVGKEGVWSKTETQGRKIEELSKKVESIPTNQITQNKEAIENLDSKLNGRKIQATLKGYIDTNGVYQSQANNLCTDYISVSQDEKFIYHGKYAKGTFKAVWGYSDNQGSNPIALVDFTGEEQTTEFTIDNEQVKYIIAWGNTDTEVWVAKEGISKQVDNNTRDILYLKTNIKYGLTVVVDANGKGDYTSLQEALYKVNDSADTHITILVMPGIYVMDEYDSTKRHFANNRNLSIIGLDRNTCIVRNDNGNYTTNPYVDNAPFKLSGKVLISNLTIISSDEQNNAGNGIAYCVHVDSEANEGDIMEIRDCILYNNHGACIGIGLRQGFTLKIVGCEVKSDLKSDDLTQTWQGAIICHDQLKSDVTNENLFIKDSLVESNSEVCIVVNSATYKNSIDLIAIGNTIVSTNSTRALTVNSPNTKNIRTGNNNIVQK